MMNSLIVIAIACLVQFSHAAAKPGVIYIIADDLGNGGLSVYCQTNFSAPNIDAIAMR